MTNKALDLSREPILPLLLKMSWPSITAMLALAVYNLIDTFWLTRVSPQAIAALTICFPIQMIFGAIGVGTGLGAGSFAARMFGAGKDVRARQTAGQVIILSVIFGFLIILLTLLYDDLILKIFGAPDEILSLSRQYLVTVSFGSPFLLFMMMSNNLLRAEGRPYTSMVVVLVMSVVGAILDPILILGLGPFPRMGILGAAISAVIAYAVAGMLSFYYLQSKSSKYDLRWQYLLPNMSIIYAIYQTGFPSLIMNLFFGLVMIVYNHVLSDYGSLAIATLGLCFRINGLVVMVLFGIGHGVMPMVGFNEGARLYDRLIETVNVAVKWTTIFCIASFILFEIFAHSILTLFTDDARLIEIAVPALRIFVSMLLLVGPNLVWINMFIGLGKGLTSMTLLLMRDAVFLIPMIFILPSWFGLNGVWMAQPLSNLLAFFMILFWTKREFRSIRLHH
ncbi:MAG: MATE family efflux transporter [Deltaproteobacteria bacterium]|nr:MATE family efflux transporter [Deltaproteobacteria bacterium]